jgi:hypothetical protein
MRETITKFPDQSRCTPTGTIQLGEPGEETWDIGDTTWNRLAPREPRLWVRNRETNYVS